MGSVGVGCGEVGVGECCIGYGEMLAVVVHATIYKRDFDSEERT